MLRLLVRLRQSRKLEGFKALHMRSIIWSSVSPVILRISSKELRSAQAAQMTQSGLF